MALLTLKPVPPFRLDLTVWVLRRLPINQMDCWDGQMYRRLFVLGGKPVSVEVIQGGPPQEPELTVKTPGSRLNSRMREELLATLDKVLGLNVDLAPFYRIAAQDRRLASLVEPIIGFKPPRLPSVFETLLNGIACQQVSLVVGVHLLNRLCRTFGLAAGEDHAFPRPADLTSALPQHLRGIGFSIHKAEAILGIAHAVLEGRLDLEELSTLDDAAVLERLLQLKGIGRWTAQYVLLRGLGRLDVFPADDVGSQSKMQRWLGRSDRPGYEQMYRILAPWRPYRGLVYFCLLLQHQHRQGLLSA